jgi:hypothetical protein
MPSLFPWTLSFLRPYRGRVWVGAFVWLLAFLSLLEIGLGALQPWPMAIVFNYVLVGYPLPASVQPWVDVLTHGSAFRL